MKVNKLLYKHMAVYLFAALMGFLAVTIICRKISYNRVFNSYSERLYSQATEISNNYAMQFFGDDQLRIIELELKTIAKLNETRIFFITPDGKVILDTDFDYSEVETEHSYLYLLDNFDYGQLDGAHQTLNNFYGLYSENVLSVYAPITNSFELKGYAVICMPESIITQRVNETFFSNYISLIIVLLVSSLFIFLYFFQIHRPINQIMKATTEYSKGNLAYHIQPLHNDEIGRLALSLDYMASQLNEMDMFQQKFLSNISHDFRSPLTSIKGYLEAIQDGTVPPEMINKYIKIILFETERLTKLTSNILTLNELDPKSVRLELSSFDLNSIIRHTVETFEGKCKEKNINFDITYAREKELVKADKGRIQQVIYNLIDNAIKFSPEKSTIFITVKEKGDKAHISIKDTGCGIAREDIDKIWDRFYKSDSSRGRDKKGSGLGLSITKEVIQAHNENIDVISTLGVGTEFIFTLPLSN